MKSVNPFSCMACHDACFYVTLFHLTALIALHSRWSAPLVVSQPFTIMLSRMCAGGKLPVKQMPCSEVHNRTIKINGLIAQQVLFEREGLCQALHC